MRKIIIAIIGSLAVLPTAAFAGKANRQDPRVEQLIQLLQQATQPQTVEPAAIVARKGSVRFRLTFVSRSPLATFSNPMRCGASISHSTGAPNFLAYYASEDMPISFTANPPDTKTCAFETFYDFPQANDAGTLCMSLFLQTDSTDESPTDKTLNYLWPLPCIALPANLQTTVINRTFNVP